MCVAPPPTASSSSSSSSASPASSAADSKQKTEITMMKTTKNTRTTIIIIINTICYIAFFLLRTLYKILKYCITLTFLIPLLSIGLMKFYLLWVGQQQQQGQVSHIPPPPSDYGTGQMFDLIANRYDFINKALALNMDHKWRLEMVNEVLDRIIITNNNKRSSSEHNGGGGTTSSSSSENNNKVKILDLATGTADVAILLGQEGLTRLEFPSSSSSSNDDNDDHDYDHDHDDDDDDDDDDDEYYSIIGVDPSKNMINVGNTKISKLNDLNTIIKLQIGDSRLLSSYFPSNTFNAITMAFGIRNVPLQDHFVALCEMHHVLKKGETTGTGTAGTLAILEFSEPSINEFGYIGQIATLFIRHVVPVIGAVLSGKPKEYIHLQNSIQNFPKPDIWIENVLENVRCPIEQQQQQQQQQQEKGQEQGDEEGEDEERSLNEEDNGKKKKNKEMNAVGTFRLDKLKQMNYGSVQLYIATPIILPTQSSSSSSS